MDAAEYLEKLFAESFRRELDHDENIVRSLPFFATALALAATVVGYTASRLPPLGRDWYAILVYLMLTGAVACVGAVLWNLFAAIRPRSYARPPQEAELLTWSETLRDYWEQEGLDSDELEAAIVDDLREKIVEDLALAAEINRANNLRKSLARTRGLTYLICALGLVFTEAVVTFVVGRLNGTGP